jgi:hypothetical protein
MNCVVAGKLNVKFAYSVEVTTKSMAEPTGAANRA